MMSEPIFTEITLSPDDVDALPLSFVDGDPRRQRPTR
jgi:hypothetical protein